MKYNDVWDFRDRLVKYLEEQKELYTQDIEQNKQLSEPEKEEKGLLIRDVTIEGYVDNEYSCSFKINNTKLRPGDKVFLINKIHHEKISGMVIENQSESMCLECSAPPQWKNEYQIEVQELVMLDPLIQLLKNLEDGMPGVFFLKELAKLESPEELQNNSGVIPSLLTQNLNTEQLQICNRILRRPSVYCIQGPPGTGKTNVLSVASIAMSLQRQNVLVIAKTHQAVNNALEKIADKAAFANVVKVGSLIKAPDATNVKSFRTFGDFMRDSRRNPSYYGSIVGLTLQSAIINLGLQNTGFMSRVVLVDEASQIQLAEAASIGTFGTQSIVFIGDDKQMPPIFHEQQRSNPLSVSVFERLVKLYADFEDKLHVTYRMNQELTEFVSTHYYEPFGEKLISSDFSKSRDLVLSTQHSDERINDILSTSKSLIHIDVSESELCEDSNPEEATFIANLLNEYISSGKDYKSVAVITPFRKQVLAIREAASSLLGAEVPIIDTVERLQGQDVDMIIISVGTTSQRYYSSVREFLLNPNRLNVMISRAKMKAVVICKDFIWEEITRPLESK